jgi:hypothetical protein
LIFQALPTVAPWVALPACIAVFLALALAFGLVLWTDLEKIVDLIRAKLVRI